MREDRFEEFVFCTLLAISRPPSICVIFLYKAKLFLLEINVSLLLYYKHFLDSVSASGAVHSLNRVKLKSISTSSTCIIKQHIEIQNTFHAVLPCIDFVNLW